MGYALGVDFGTTKTTVAMVTRAGGVGQKAVHETVLAEAPSVVFLGHGDEIAIGLRAEERGLPNPHLLIRDFKRRLGDSVPVVAGARSVAAESMAALLICELVRDAVAAAGATPEALTVTYPGTWGPYKQDLLAKALEDAGLPDFELVSEPAAAIRNALGVEPAHATVIVYDLGGSSFDVSVMRRTALGEFEIVGRPQQLDGIGGADFDQAVFSYVQQCAALNSQDVSDPRYWPHCAQSGRPVAKRRRRCRTTLKPPSRSARRTYRPGCGWSGRNSKNSSVTRSRTPWRPLVRASLPPG